MPLNADFLGLLKNKGGEIHTGRKQFTAFAQALYGRVGPVTERRQVFYLFHDLLHFFGWPLHRLHPGKEIIHAGLADVKKSQKDPHQNNPYCSQDGCGL